MKNLLIILLLVISNAVTSCHGSNSKKEAVAMPESVLSSFHQKYPDATDVDWKQEQKDDKTIFDGYFKKDGKKVCAKYDDAGNFIEEK